MPSAVAQMSPIVAAIAAPIITALLAAIGVWWKGRRDRHDMDRERLRVLAEVHEEINVIEAWIKAYSLVASRETEPQKWSRAENDLEDSYLKLAVSLKASRGLEKHPLTFGPHLTVLLLLQPLQSRSAEFVRILYYVSLVGVSIWVSVIIAVSISQPRGAGSLIIGFVVFLVANLLISAGSYMLVLRLDRRARAKEHTQAARLPRMI